MVWPTKQLGEISTVNYGYTAKASFEAVGPKFLRITDIQDDRVNWENVPSCEITDVDFKKHKLFSGDIVFARTGATTGKSYLLSNPPVAIAASYLIRLRLKDKTVLPNYVAKFFQTWEYWEKVRAGTSGSAQGGFNASKLSGMSVPLPPLLEQQKIVATLDEAFARIDAAVANTKKNLTNARELFDSYLNNTFTQKGYGWVEKQLSEVCEKITDGTHQTPKYFDAGFIFLSSKNVKEGVVDWDNIKYIDEGQHIKMQKRLAPRINDILLRKNGAGYGKAAIVDKDIIFDVYVSLAVLRPLKFVSPKFLLHYINSPTAMKQFNHRIKGAGVPNLHLKEIREVVVSFPEGIADQEQIVSRLELLTTETKRLETIYQKKLDALAELKQSILQKAFSGELTKQEVVAA